MWFLSNPHLVCIIRLGSQCLSCLYLSSIRGGDVGLWGDEYRMDTSAEIPASPLLPWSNMSRAGCPGPVLLTGSSACRVGAVRAAALKVGLRKGNGPQGTEIPCSPTAGLKAVRLPPLSTLLSALWQGCGTGTSNLFKTSAVHVKHVWWCGFVSSLGKVSLFIKDRKKAEVH